MPFPFKNTGYIPSHHIDHPTIATTAPSDTLYVAPIDGLPIFMQGKRPTCVSHGVAWAKMQYDLKHTGQFKTLSRRFLHALSKQPGQIPGDGRSIESVLAVAEKYGIPEEQYLPEDDSLTDAEYEDASKIPAEAYQNALQHKIGSHAYLTDLSLQGHLKRVVDRCKRQRDVGSRQDTPTTPWIRRQPPLRRHLRRQHRNEPWCHNELVES
jgi:hypothetical protein